MVENKGMWMLLRVCVMCVCLCLCVCGVRGIVCGLYVACACEACVRGVWFVCDVCDVCVVCGVGGACVVVVCCIHVGVCEVIVIVMYDVRACSVYYSTCMLCVGYHCDPLHSPRDKL